MSEKRNLHVELTLGIGDVLRKTFSLKNNLNLVGSTLAAVFRTTVVAGFFMALREVYNIVGGISSAIKTLTGEFAKFNYASMLTATVMAEGGAATQETFEKISEYARKASTEVQYTATQIQEGLFTAAQAGFNLEGAIKVSTSALQLSTIVSSDFKATLKGLIGVVRAFDIEMKDIPATASMISAAVAKSMIEMEGFFTAMSYAASAAAVNFGTAKDTIIDASAAIMTMSDVGITASRSGTYLRGAITQLQAATSKVTTAFAKYGVNIYQADGESQKYFATLTKGQGALAKYDEKLNSLKQQQYDLALAGNENTEEFRNLSDEINKVMTSMGVLEKGTSDVYEQFLLSGGKLKPFAEILRTMKATMPTEMISKIFGVRSGQGLASLLQNFGLFEKHREELARFYEEAEKGKSILGEMFAKMLGTITVKWERIKNTVSSTLNAIWQPLFEAISPLLDTLLSGLERVYTWVEANKGIFKKLFIGVVESIAPIINRFSEGFIGVVEKTKEAVMGTGKLEIPMFTVKKGEVTPTTAKTITSGDIGTRLLAVFESILSFVSATIEALFEKLKPVLDKLGTALADAVIAVLEAKKDVFIKLGAAIGTGFIQAIPEALWGMGKDIAKSPQTITETLTFGTTLVLTGGNIPAAVAATGLHHALNEAVKKQVAEKPFEETLANISPFVGISGVIKDFFNKLNPLSTQLVGVSNNYDKASGAIINAGNTLLKQSEKTKVETEKLQRRVYVQ